METKITVLGSGSSGNAYLLDDGKSQLLIEVGLPFNRLQKALNYKLTAVAGALVSHEHGDHAQGAKKLARAGINIYMSEGTKEALDPKEYRFRTFEKEGDRYMPRTIGTFIVTPFKVIHDCQEPIGFLITSLEAQERILFVTDTEYSPYTFKNIDVFMVEINYTSEVMDRNLQADSDLLHRRNRTVASHMSLDTAIEFLKKSNAGDAKAIYVLHLSDLNSDEAAIKTALEREFDVPVVIC